MYSDHTTFIVLQQYTTFYQWILMILGGRGILNSNYEQLAYRSFASVRKTNAQSLGLNKVHCSWDVLPLDLKNLISSGRVFSVMGIIWQCLIQGLYVGIKAIYMYITGLYSLILGSSFCSVTCMAKAYLGIVSPEFVPSFPLLFVIQQSKHRIGHKHSKHQFRFQDKK